MGFRDIFKRQDRQHESAPPRQPQPTAAQRAQLAQQIQQADQDVNRALSCVNSGDLVNAENLFLRALQVYDQAYAPDNQTTLNVVNNLGVVYARLKKFPEAETMLKRAVEGRKATLGPEHRSTLDSMVNLGHAYKEQQKWGIAEVTYMNAGMGLVKTLGEGHPMSKSVAGNITLCHFRQAATQGNVVGVVSSRHSGQEFMGQPVVRIPRYDGER